MYNVSHMKKIDLFLCTKPLQYLNALNIPYKNNGHDKILLVVGQFYQAESFVENIKKSDDHWDQVLYFKSNLAAYFYIFCHNVKNLYIRYDNGTFIAIMYYIKHYNLYLMEEGAATYLDYYFKKNKVRKFFDDILGASSYLGHSTYLKGAYVYYTEFYKSRKNVKYDVLPFKYGFLEAIESKFDFFLSISQTEDLSFLDISDSRILVYVTDWIINDKIIDLISKDKSLYDKVYIKPHPHILSSQSTFPCGVDLIQTNLMIEFIFYKWLKNNNKITVYHEGTSAVFYYNCLIESIDMSQNRDSEYNQLIANPPIF